MVPCLRRRAANILRDKTFKLEGFIVACQFSLTSGCSHNRRHARLRLAFPHGLTVFAMMLAHVLRRLLGRRDEGHRLLRVRVHLEYIRKADRVRKFGPSLGQTDICVQRSPERAQRYCLVAQWRLPLWLLSPRQSSPVLRRD